MTAHFLAKPASRRQYREGFLSALLFYLLVVNNPIFGPVTTTRVAVMLLLIVWLIMSPNKLFRIDRRVLFLSLIPVFIFALSLVSYALNGGALYSVYSWLFMALVVILVGGLSSQWTLAQVEGFLWGAVIVALGVWALVVVGMAVTDVNVFNPSHVRRWFSEDYFSNLNRFMNVQFIFCSLALGALALNMVRSRIFALCAAVLVASSIGMFLYTGSRQNVLAVVCVAALLIVAVYFSSDKAGVMLRHLIRWVYRSVLVLVLLGLLAFLGVEYGLVDSDYMLERFFGAFHSGHITDSDATRLYLASQAVGASLLPLGIGPGNFVGIYGYYPHNGYLGLAAEVGAYGVVFIMGVFFVGVGRLMVRAFRERNHLAILVWLAFFVVAILLANVGTVFRDPLYWGLVGLAAAASQYDVKRCRRRSLRDAGIEYRAD
ncbi:hypothetical protein ABC977_08110 [Thioalkalicoccus limnaeus]|uniref:O-antigen polymerase n=1 Tax=Thioalkalicoccus limnaeus TaxID=120681 RepID=A0ABV4BDJ6_9GAMM